MNRKYDRIFFKKRGRLKKPMKRIILDTDIGSDIDDTWAVCFLLNHPEIEIVLVSVTDGDTDYRARLVRTILRQAGKDIPVVQGKASKQIESPFEGILQRRNDENKDYVAAYRCALKENVDAVISIGPSTSLTVVADIIAEAGVSVHVMGGSIREGYFGGPISAECNVVQNPAAFRGVMQAIGKRYYLYPLDICNSIIMQGENYRKVLRSEDRVTDILLRHYFYWDKVYTGGAQKADISVSSTILYDLAPVWGALMPEDFTYKSMKVAVTDEGMTVENDAFGTEIFVAESADIERLLALTVEVLSGERKENAKNL